MSTGRDEFDDIRSLLALKPSEDLTPDEARKVEESLRYSELARQEAAQFEKCLAVIREAGSLPTMADDRPSLWSRIEPQLGPAGRSRPQTWSQRVLATPSWVLLSVALLLAAVNLIADRGLWSRWVPTSVAKAPETSVFQVNNRSLPISVDPQDERGFVRPLLGLIVCECEGGLDGAVVVGIMDGSPAADAGLRRNDLIVGLDGCRIKGPSCLIGCLRQHAVGQKIDVTYLRDGREHSVSVFLGGIIEVGGKQLMIRERRTELEPLNGF